jgi:hypothetical protein
MQWIAPSEKDTASATLEKQLWAAADQLRANSGLKAAEYSAPGLGLIFLRFAETRFALQRAKLETAATSSRRGSRVDDPTAYHAEGMLYLPAEARFDNLLHLPEAANVGAKVNDAMRAIEQQNPQLAGVLPKTYTIFGGTLLKQLLKKMSEIPISADYDTFGRVYEYFLAEFAMTEGQGGGEFYTPFSIVRLLTEVIEPYHGRILDPACGSGGMFVQSARFVSEHQKNPSKELAIYGQEKERATGDLCRMNLAVHGLEGDIKQAISYYDDPHAATGRFDFVLANPPFNVNAVDKERLADAGGRGQLVEWCRARVHRPWQEREAKHFDVAHDHVEHARKERACGDRPRDRPQRVAGLVAERGGALEADETERRQDQPEHDASRGDVAKLELGGIDQRAPGQHHEHRQGDDRRERADLEGQHQSGRQADVAARADAGDADAGELPDHGQRARHRGEEHVHEVGKAAGDGHGGEQVRQAERPRRNHACPRPEPLSDDVGERTRGG